MSARWNRQSRDFARRGCNSRAAGETATGGRQIAAAAEEADPASRQAATASAEQAQGAEDLAAAIEEIASLARRTEKPMNDATSDRLATERYF